MTVFDMKSNYCQHHFFKGNWNSKTEMPYLIRSRKSFHTNNENKFILLPVKLIYFWTSEQRNFFCLCVCVFSNKNYPIRFFPISLSIMHRKCQPDEDLNMEKKIDHQKKYCFLLKCYQNDFRYNF
jgi:hypothetical protein